jgi:hypothetical protein
MKKVKKIIFTVLIAFISAATGSYITMERSETEASIKHINAMLYDLNIELDLLEYWESEYENDQVLEEKIKHLIINKMLAVAVIKPNVGDLQGIPLKSLQRLINLSKENRIELKNFDNANNAAIIYLSSIEDDVEDILSKRKSVHKTPFVQR